MPIPDPIFRRAGGWLGAAALLACACDVHAADTYVPGSGQLTIPTLAIGSLTYTNVTVIVGAIVTAPSGTSANDSQDSYDPATGRLTVAAVTLGGTTYYNAVTTVSRLVSIGGVTGADSYDGSHLTIPTVQAGTTTYSKVVLAVTLASVVRVDGGLPAAALDQYDPATGHLTIAAVRVGNTVYTNVIVAVAANNIVSVGGSGPYTVYVIPAPGGYSVIKAAGISDSDVIVGSAQVSGGYLNAALWNGLTAGSLHDLNPSATAISFATAISGTQTVGAGNTGLLWNGTTAASATGLVGSGLGGSDVALGISGSNIVGRGYAYAVLWTGGGTTAYDLHPQGYLSSDANGVSGTLVVGDALDYSGNNHAFAWTGTTRSTAIDLSPASGYPSSVANAVSGTTVVGIAFNGSANHAAAWTTPAGASFVDLHPSAYVASFANAISAAGIVGYGLVSDGVTGHALLWGGATANAVDLQGYLSGSPVTITDSQATGINSRGDIVGNGKDKNGAAYIVLWKKN